MLITTDEIPRKNDDEKGNMNELEKHDHLPIRNGNESIMEKNNVDIYHANKGDIMENKLNKTIKS